MNKIAPRTNTSEIYVSLGSSNNFTTLTLPEGTQMIRIYFDNAGTKVRGRVGFSGADGVTPANATDGDGKTGHQGPDIAEYTVPGWAKKVHLASSTANAKVFGVIFYN